MDAERKKWLVDNSEDIMLEGSPATIGGWRNEYAGLAPRFGGFWRVEWEVVERVLANDRNFTAQDVTFLSWRWLGFGDPVPESLQHYI